jgi:L-lysine exporter family protein LysE/ArgO
MFDAAIHGFLVSISLIMAIGAQNAFVLRQGIRREHVLPVVLTCAGSDAILISMGVAGFGFASTALPWLGTAMRWGGVAFLVVYGALRFRAAMRGGESLRPQPGGAASLRTVLTTVLVLTWANPHVYLDTVVLLGSIASQYDPFRFSFGVGACLGSLAFFLALGFGARFLAPIFEKPRAWVVLEIIVGATMWGIALTLALGG